MTKMEKMLESFILIRDDVIKAVTISTKELSVMHFGDESILLSSYTASKYNAYGVLKVLVNVNSLWQQYNQMFDFGDITNEAFPFKVDLERLYMFIYMGEDIDNATVDMNIIKDKCINVLVNTIKEYFIEYTTTSAFSELYKEINLYTNLELLLKD
jgi:hypothetical protein